MGSKPKFWYREPSGQSDWLFKYPQAGTGQHWAEKVAAEVARAIEVPHAAVELAEVEGRGGIYWSAGGRYGPSPLDLLRHAASHYPALFQKPIRQVTALSGDSLTAIVRRVPADWMSRPAREFAATLLAYNAAEITQCLE